MNLVFKCVGPCHACLKKYEFNVQVYKSMLHMSSEIWFLSPGYFMKHKGSIRLLYYARHCENKNDNRS